MERQIRHCVWVTDAAASLDSTVQSPPSAAPCNPSSCPDADILCMLLLLFPLPTAVPCHAAAKWSPSSRGGQNISLPGVLSEVSSPFQRAKPRNCLSLRKRGCSEKRRISQAVALLVWPISSKRAPLDFQTDAMYGRVGCFRRAADRRHRWRGRWMLRQLLQPLGRLIRQQSA